MCAFTQLQFEVYLGVAVVLFCFLGFVVVFGMERTSSRRDPEGFGGEEEYNQNVFKFKNCFE